ncbi:hypothetical protein BGW80DRAFT_1328298, partial [Lactifluus volemus]
MPKRMFRKPANLPLARKPVIHFYPPSSLSHVTVQLSSVYPQPQAFTNTPDERESLTWTVAAEPDGILVDKTTRMEVSYLYWKAV